MSISDKICRKLLKVGFEYDPPENTFVVYKALESGGEATMVMLYFSDDDGKGKLDFGFWIDGSVNKTLRNNLKVELHNVAVGNKCSDPEEVSDDEGGFWVFCTITVINDSIVDWVKSTMEELERRAMFIINK